MLDAQIVIKKPEGGKKKVEWTTDHDNIQLRGAAKWVIDSVKSETLIDSTWVYNLFQVNHFDSKCRIIKDSIAIDFWDNGEWDPFFNFIEYYFYGNDDLLDEELSIDYTPDDGIFTDSSFRVSYFYKNGLLDHEKRENWEEKPRDSIGFTIYFYDTNHFLSHSFSGENIFGTTLYSNTQYVTDAYGKVLEQVSAVSESSNGPFFESFRSVFNYNAQQDFISEVTYHKEDSIWKVDDQIDFLYNSAGLPVSYLYRSALDTTVLLPFSRGRVFARFGCESSASKEAEKDNIKAVMANPFEGGRVVFEGEGATQQGLFAEITDIYGRILQRQRIEGGQATFSSVGYSGVCILTIRKDGLLLAHHKIIGL